GKTRGYGVLSADEVRADSHRGEGERAGAHPPAGVVISRRRDDRVNLVTSHLRSAERSARRTAMSGPTQAEVEPACGTNRRDAVEVEGAVADGVVTGHS